MLNILMVNKNYWSKYYQEHKEKYKEYVKKYQQSEKGQKKIKEYRKEYMNRPKVKKRRLIYDRENHTAERKTYKTINSQIRKCIVRDLKYGDIKISKNTYNKYFWMWKIDLYKIINSLKPIPKDIENYELDHIIPLYKFDFSKREDIIKAYDPMNLQLLTKKENQIKGSKS